MNDLKKKIIAALNLGGADIVKFADAERFRDPNLKALFPAVKTVVGAAFRQLRGTRRGIEEGSTYYQYTTNAIEVLEENVMPRALLRAASVLEEAGFDALPQVRNQLIMKEENDVNPEMDYRDIYRGVTAEHQLDFKLCAVDSGLGEIGLSGSLLTDEFGPCQRYCFLLTDAEITPDQPFVPHLCDHCGECVAHCPGHAISADGKRDNWQCAVYYNGANMTKNPFLPPEAFADDPERLNIISGEAKVSPERARELLDQLIYYPPMKHSYRSSICGHACDTACYIHLEEKGVLSRKFKTPFRKRPEWKLPIH